MRRLPRRLWSATLALVAILGAGCVYHHRWGRPGATASDFYRDSQACHHEVDPRWSFCTGDACTVAEARGRDAMARCLRARGWNSRGVASITGGSDEEYAGE
jgi:hypothetical protein